MATHVTMIQAFGFPSQYLMFDGSSVAVHSIQTHPANFHLKLDSNTLDRYLEVFNVPGKRFHLTAQGDCSGSHSNAYSVSDTHSTIARTTSGSSNVKIYFENGSSERFYLRVNLASGNAVELVCQDYADNAQGFALKELQFNLIQVDINDMTSRRYFPRPPPAIIRGPFRPVITVPVKPDKPVFVRGGPYVVRNNSSGSSDDEGVASGRGFTEEHVFTRLNSNEVVGAVSN